jgi:uncharacterized membrane protein YoaK (UPF0700 family)
MMANRASSHRRRAVLFILHATLPPSFIQCAPSSAGVVEVSWNGDYRQLHRRLRQAYHWSQAAVQQGREACEHAVGRGRELYQAIQEERHERQYRHLYPYLEKSPASASSLVEGLTTGGSTVTEDASGGTSVTPTSTLTPFPTAAQAALPSRDLQAEGFRPSTLLLSPALTRGGQQQQQQKQPQQGRVVSRGGSSSGHGVGTSSSSAEAFRTAVTLGIVLAFNSGFINGCCLSGATTAHHNSAAKQAVASVTGAYTNSALGFASGNLSQFATQLQILLSYIFGSAIAGSLNPRPIAMDFSSSAASRSHPALLIAGALLAVSSYLAGRTSASSVGSGSGRSGVYTYFLLAAMANGLQNSVTSSTTANLCRTTHYTGISTDIGTYVGQLLRGNSANSSRLRVFCGLAASFWTGGVVSYFVVQKFGGWSLLLGAAIYFFVGSGLLQRMFLAPVKPTPTFTTTRFDTTSAAESSDVEDDPAVATPDRQAPLVRRSYPQGGLQSLAM